MENKMKWYRLDTSAKIYPALESIRNPSIFRMSITLKKKVNPHILLEALENIKDRFPYYNVHMKKGLFWSYLEQNTHKSLVWKDTQSPCSRIHPAFNHGYLYKVRYFNKKISIDMFHVLTDGYGAMEFLKCIIAEYLLLIGDIDEIDTEFIMDKNAEPESEEYEDAFIRVLENERHKLPQEKKRSLFGKNKCFKLKDNLIPVGKYRVITGIIPVEDLKKICKKYDATITQLMASLYLEALLHLQAEQEKNKKKHKNIAVQLPVNMRRFYPINCMRNFSLFIIPFIDPREVKKLEDIIREVKSFMGEHITEDHLLTMVEDNCSLASNLLIRHVPLFLKNIVIRFITNTSGSTQFSGTLSNLGVVKLTENIKPHVDFADFVLGPSTHDKCACSMASFDDKVAVTFGQSIRSTYVPEYVFSKLVKLGCHVELKSNF